MYCNEYYIKNYVIKDLTIERALDSFITKIKMIAFQSDDTSPNLILVFNLKHISATLRNAKSHINDKQLWKVVYFQWCYKYNANRAC